MTLFLGVLSSTPASCFIIISTNGDLVRSFRGVIEDAISVGRFVFFVERLRKKNSKIVLSLREDDRYMQHQQT